MPSNLCLNADSTPLQTKESPLGICSFLVSRLYILCCRLTILWEADLEGILVTKQRLGHCRAKAAPIGGTVPSCSAIQSQGPHKFLLRRCPHGVINTCTTALLNKALHPVAGKAATSISNIVECNNKTCDTSVLLSRYDSEPGLQSKKQNLYLVASPPHMLINGRYMRSQMISQTGFCSLLLLMIAQTIKGFLGNTCPL